MSIRGEDIIESPLVGVATTFRPAMDRRLERDARHANQPMCIVKDCYDRSTHSSGFCLNHYMAMQIRGWTFCPSMATSEPETWSMHQHMRPPTCNKPQGRIECDISQEHGLPPWMIDPAPWLQTTDQADCPPWDQETALQPTTPSELEGPPERRKTYAETLATVMEISKTATQKCCMQECPNQANPNKDGRCNECHEDDGYGKPLERYHPYRRHSCDAGEQKLRLKMKHSTR